MEHNQTHTHPEIPREPDSTSRPHNNPTQRRTLITAPIEEITIPLPTYGYGAIRRARFAFGRITQAQARTNTANQFRQQLSVDTTNQEEPEPEEDLADTETHFPEDTEEEEEENIFLNDVVPTTNECA